MLQKATFKVCGRKFDTCSTKDFINEEKYVNLNTDILVTWLNHAKRSCGLRHWTAEVGSNGTKWKQGQYLFLLVKNYYNA